MKKQLFLASSIDFTAKDIAKKINQPGARVLFVTTASEPFTDISWLKRHREALVAAGFELIDYTITGKTKREVAKALSGQDILYMSGGNGLYLLEQIQQAKCASVLKQFVEEGHVYLGSSAGAFITAPNIQTAYIPESAEKASKLQSYDALGLVDFMIFPHWGSEAFRKTYFDIRLEHAYNQKQKIVLLTDLQYIQVEDDWYKIVDIK
jgi:peptidase E